MERLYCCAHCSRTRDEVGRVPPEPVEVRQRHHDGLHEFRWYGRQGRSPIHRWNGELPLAARNLSWGHDVSTSQRPVDWLQSGLPRQCWVDAATTSCALRSAVDTIEGDKTPYSLPHGCTGSARLSSRSEQSSLSRRRTTTASRTWGQKAKTQRQYCVEFILCERWPRARGDSRREYSGEGLLDRQSGWRHSRSQGSQTRVVCSDRANEDDAPLVPMTAIDVTRRTRTNSGHADTQEIDDIWCGDVNDARCLSDFWAGETVFDKLQIHPPGCEITWGRPMRTQNAARPGDIWPEMGKL